MAMPEEHIWSGMLAHLRAHHAVLCRHWFEQLEPRGIAFGVLWLRAPSITYRDYLLRQCAEAFNDAARTASGMLITVRFLGPDDEPDLEPDPMTRPAAKLNGAAPAATRRDSHPINPDYTFDQFVVGPNNRMAHAAAHAVANKLGKGYNPLFIHGGVGLGKTHLLQAICIRMRECFPSLRYQYVSCDEFMNHFIDAVKNGAMADFHHRFRDADVLVVDDIHFISKRERSQEEFFHTFNSLHQSNRQIILSSDAPPDDIPNVVPRLVSRFKCGLVADIGPPGFETRVAILKQKAQLREYELSDDIAAYVAQRIDTNIRELEGAIVKIQMQASMDGRPPDLAAVQTLLGEPPERQGPTIHTIVSAVTEFFGVRPGDMTSKRRHRSITTPRQVCMYLARNNTRHSLEEIGSHFGNRDHTTVLHAVRAIEERCRVDKDLETTVRDLQERLNRPKA